MESVRERGGILTDATRLAGEVKRGYTGFREGDVLVAKITPCFENGKGAIAEGLLGGVGFGTSELHVVRPERADRRWVFYVTQSKHFTGYGEGAMYGAGGQKRVPPDFLRNYAAPTPPLPTQRAIAAYLDCKTAAIDALIEKKQKLLELLAEKRAALINQVVSKGLDPDVPMKDSGVPWIGEIPAHWEVKKLSWLLRDGPRNGVSPAVSSTGAGVPSFTLSVVRNGIVEVKDEDVKHVGATSSDVARFTVRADDLLLVRGNGNINLVGGTGLVLKDDLVGYVYPDLLMRMRCCGTAHPGFLRYCINSDAVRPQITAAARTTVGTYKVNNEQVRELRVIHPHHREAAAISAYLDRRLIRHTEHTATVQTQVDLLHEYRQALITAAVTGQLNISEDAA